MYLVQLLLPLYDNSGRRFPRSKLNRVEETLAQRFGGITMYTRAPAEGLSKHGSGGMTQDEIVVFEIMAGNLERAWWKKYRAQLERVFRQDCVVVRATKIELL
jgi:hypothetical protein